MTNFGTIYCFTCSVSNKKYIGQTWKQVVGTSGARYSLTGGGATSLFKRAIAKYGYETFELEILESVTSQQELDSAERKWILELNTKAPFGYNLASGGGQTGIVHRSTRRKISNTLKGIPKPPRTREHCKKISMSKRGRKLSAEHKRKIGAALKGREIPLSQRIFLSKSRMGENNPMFGTIPWNKGMKTKVELEPSVVKHADLKDPE